MSDGVGLLQCRDRERQFRMQCSLSQHRRSAHPEEYHLAIVPKERKKAPWEHNEMVLLVQREINALTVTGKVNIKKLAESLPDRTYESIRGVRKGAVYKKLFSSFSSSVGTHDGAP